ncbi:glyoxalase superfamily protein [uncultured Tateyamaria sp.]|uniref:glyoxalase superfamily protein n=1 Tax=uncultured Tateyamaria sp. TaxID=455651 RepID=UPI00344F7523
MRSVRPKKEPHRGHATSLRNAGKGPSAAPANKGSPIEHAKSLELVAKNYGFRDCITMYAAIRQKPANACPTAIADSVPGWFRA